MQEIVTPIIHLNGTSCDNLLEVRRDAYAALYDAYEKLKETAPNGRDYYPEPGRLEKARTQHFRRLQTLQDLMDEIEKEMDLISK